MTKLAALRRMPQPYVTNEFADYLQQWRSVVAIALHEFGRGNTDTAARLLLEFAEPGSHEFLLGLPFDYWLRTAAETDDNEVRLVNWEPRVKASLRGFAAVEYAFGLTIPDIAVFCRRGKAWARLPSKPMVTRAGELQRDGKGGIRHATIIRFTSPEIAQRFSDRVTALVEQHYPGSIRGDGPIIVSDEDASLFFEEEAQ